MAQATGSCRYAIISLVPGRRAIRAVGKEEPAVR
jgi:hypothetical protein